MYLFAEFSTNNQSQFKKILCCYFIYSVSLMAAYQSEQIEKSPKLLWQGWSLSIEAGSHFKTLSDANFSNVTTGWGHKKEYWGEFGVLGGIGFKYSHVFFNKGYWSIKPIWTYFYPDIRWEGKASAITLSSIPFIGEYISLGTAPGYWTMILIPIIYFDIGYITENNIIFSLGSAYLWGISSAVTVPLGKNFNLEWRTTIFLDRILFNSGFHNFMNTIGINYQF